MSPAELAHHLFDGTDLAAAGLLVAIWQRDDVSVPREDMYLVRQLEALGCVLEGKTTKLGRRTAVRLNKLGVGA